MKKNCGSTLKNFKWGNMSEQEIINKYEDVLETREIQVTDLSMELGKLQEKTLKIEEKNEQIINDFNLLKSENEKLALILKKKDFFLNQELQNKEHMFYRLQEKENECDLLNQKITELKNEIEKLKKTEGRFVNDLFKEDKSLNEEKTQNKIIISAKQLYKSIDPLSMIKENKKIEVVKKEEMVINENKTTETTDEENTSTIVSNSTTPIETAKSSEVMSSSIKSLVSSIFNFKFQFNKIG